MESLRPKYICAAPAAATRSYEPANMKIEPADEHEFLLKGKPIFSRKSVKAGPTTPVHPWAIHKEPAAHHNPTSAKLNASASSPSAPLENPSFSPVSARKLAAALWDFQFFAPLGGKMHRGSSAYQARTGLRRGQTGNKDKGVENPAEDRFPDQPETASSLKRHIAAALMQHHRSMDKRNVSQQPLSPASYSSSMEMTRYNPIIPPSPTSSLEFKGRIGESSYSLKTSTELLKVLNRIWSLEEQHASSVSLIKALRMELHNARSKIKELVRDQQADRLEIEELMKQITEDQIIRKSKEQDREIQSTKDELENERQLRKRSESLHRKLAHELIEAKSSLSNTLKELERERMSRVLLEELCDEFAKGIKDYELEVHALRQKLPEKERSNGADRDRLILHVSEAWVDERMQMKIREAHTGSIEKYSVVDKLRPEVEKFLQARHSRPSGIAGQKSNRNSRESRLRRSSMESVPMNDVVSGPQDVGDDDSVDGDSHCIEMNKPFNNNDRSECAVAEGLASTSHTDQKHIPRERMKSRNPTSLQVKFEEQMSWAVSNDDNGYQLRDAEEEEHAEKLKPGRVGACQKSEICATAEYGSSTKHSRVNQESSSNYTIEHLIRNQQLMSEGGSMHLQKDPRDTSSYRKRASPVRQWMSQLAPKDPNTAESSSRNAPAVKENTLKAKLLEARMKGQRSRLKGPKGTS